MLQRAAQRADAEHLRRLRQPFVAALQGRSHAITAGLLERIGQPVRQQAADRVVFTGGYQRLDLRGGDETTRGIVHQYPVVGGRALRQQVV